MPGYPRGGGQALGEFAASVEANGQTAHFLPSTIGTMDSMAKRQSLDFFVSALRALKPELETRYLVKKVAMFGSYVRRADRKGSDLDLLVSFKEPPSLIRFIELENLPTDSLGVKVDLVMEDALKPSIGRRILEEIVPV